MADANVSVGFVGDSKSAEYAIARLQQQMQAMQEKMKHGSTAAAQSMSADAKRWQKANEEAMSASVASAQRQQMAPHRIRFAEIRKSEMAAATARQSEAAELDASSDAVDRMAMKVLGVAAAYRVVSSAIGGVVAKNEEFLSKLDAMGQIRADEELKLQIQGGFVPQEIAKRMPQIEAAVTATPSVGGSTPAEMYANSVALTTQLASSNVKDPEALGAVLKLKAGTNRFGRGVGGEAADVRELIKFAKGVGVLEPTGKDIQRIGGGISEVFEASDLQFSDISHLSPHAATLKSLGMNEMQQLAAFASLTDVQGSELSGRGLKMMGLRLSTAKDTEASGKALAELGLTPHDVAIAEGGQSLTASMRRLRDKLAPIDAETKNRLIEDIFGQEAIGVAQTMLSPGRLEQIEAWTEKASRAEGFQSKVKAFEDSRFARDRANVAATGFSLRRHDINTGEFTWREHENELEKIRSQDLEGRSAPARAFLNFGSWVEDTANWTFNKSRGATPTEAGYENPNTAKQVDIAERQLEVLERIESKSDRPRERNRNGNIETAGAN